MIGEHSIRAALLAASIAGASACSPSYDTLEVGWIQGPVEAEASSRGFSVPEGKLVVFSAAPTSDAGRDFEAIDVLALSSEQPTVARVEQGLAAGTWMIMGVAEGSTMIEVRIDGELEDRITVDVTAQEVSP
jgi:hypothetical protein